MKRKNLYKALGVIILLILLLGFLVPIDSYTIDGCSEKPIPRRLHLIFGDSIQKIKDQKKLEETSPDSDLRHVLGCTPSEKYTLYLL